MTDGAAVLCVGRVYCDLVFSGAPRLPSPGTEVFAEALSLHAGGGAAISAAWLAALGRSSALCATLPAQPFEAAVTAELSARGVDLSLCAPAAAGQDPQVTVAMPHDGDRAFLTRRSGPAAPVPDAAALVRLGVTHVHVGELRTLTEQPQILDATRAAGATVSLDCGWDDAVDARAGALIATVDVFLPNAAELAELVRHGVDTATAPLTVVKDGARGATAWHGGQSVSRAGRPADAVDATGAGDAFNAGFLDRWLAGAGLETCLDAGNRCGGLAIAAPGGCGGLDRPGPGGAAARHAAR